MTVPAPGPDAREEAGAAGKVRLARRVVELYPELSYTRAKRAVEGGQVAVDGVRAGDPRLCSAETGARSRIASTQIRPSSESLRCGATSQRS